MSKARASDRVSSAAAQGRVSREALVITGISATATIVAALIGVYLHQGGGSSAAAPSTSSGPSASASPVGASATQVAILEAFWSQNTVQVNGTATGIPSGEHVYIAVGAGERQPQAQAAAGSAAQAGQSPGVWDIAATTPDAGGQGGQIRWTGTITLDTTGSSGVSVTAFHSTTMTPPSSVLWNGAQSQSLGGHGGNTVCLLLPSACNTLSDDALAKLPHTPVQYLKPPG